MTTTGEKLTLLAEIVRVSIKGATVEEISEELSLSTAQTLSYLHFLRGRKLIVLVDKRDYFPTQKGLAYLSTFDDAADLADVDGPSGFYSGASPQGPSQSVYWVKAELAARMRDIIDR